MKNLLFTLLIFILSFDGFTQSSTSPKQYSIPEVGSSPQWIKLGTYTAPQGGSTIKLTLISHWGYNATNSQDFESTIYFKTSNGASLDSYGFAGNSNYSVTGIASKSLDSVKWVANAPGLNASAFDLFIKLGEFTLGSTYTVENSAGTWTHAGTVLISNNYGGPSNTICIAQNYHQFGSSTVFTKPQFLNDAQFFYNRFNNSSPNVFSIANDQDKFKIWSYAGANSPWNERFVLLNNGNVGIGNSNPSKKLDISGSIRVSGDSNQVGYWFPNNQAMRTGIVNSNSYFDVGNMFVRNGNADINATIRLSGSQAIGNTYYNQPIPSSGLVVEGSVGIGTFNPEQKLHVVGNAVFGQNDNLWILHPQSAPLTSLYIAPKINGNWDFSKGTIFENTGDVVFNKNISVNGKLNYGLSFTRTESREDASLQGDQGATSGFFQALNPINYPTGATSWWHLLDIRHSNNTNNYAMQFAGSFFDQKVYLRKVNNNPTQAWEQILTDKNVEGLFVKYQPNGNVGIGTTAPSFKLDVVGTGLVRSRVLSNDNQANISLQGLFGQLENASGDFYITNSSPAGEMILRTGTSLERMRIKSTGQVVVGIPTVAVPSSYLFAVAGNMITEKIKVRKQSSGWADFVFDDDYKLPTLESVEQYIKKNKHLPEIPSAAEVEKDGQDLGEMNKLLLQKVEELTLYMIEMKKENETLKKRLDKLEK